MKEYKWSVGLRHKATGTRLSLYVWASTNDEATLKLCGVLIGPECEYKDLEEYATQALLDGKPIPGWKLVAGRSNRAFTDQDAAIKAVIEAGYDEALVYDRKPKTLSQLEELMGKKEFKEKIGGFVVKPLGKPTLAEASDKREAYNHAAADFAGAVPE